MTPPVMRPLRPHFSSGPTVKRPGWSPDILSKAELGRSHRAAPAKAKINEAMERTRRVLGIPSDYLLGIVPASDTGALEMALWSLLGPRGVDVLAWESFGHGWANDIVNELKLADVRVLKAGYGELPALSQVDPARDVVFTWNGTTSGVRVPDGDWISPDRKGVTICDATSAAFAQKLDWAKLDATTFSWQKGLGGEAAHGVLVLSPRAQDRLSSHRPAWPMPKLFRLTKGGKLNLTIFAGDTINTPSLLCVEDYLDALKWAEAIGGLPALIARADKNFGLIADWVGATPWAAFMARDPRARSNTSVCLRIVAPWFERLDAEAQRKVQKEIEAKLAHERVAFDIGNHRDAPAGLRIWCGATVEAEDLKALLPWLDWAYEEIAPKS